MRIPTPCRENLDAMPRTPDGVHCASCDRNVVDLRRTPKKRALAILADLRARDPEGRVCAHVRATRDGVPVFAKDPSPLRRFTLPMALAGSLAACAPRAASEHETTPVALIPIEQRPADPRGTPATPPVAVATERTARLPPTQPAATPIEHVEMRGDIAFDGP